MAETPAIESGPPDPPPAPQHAQRSAQFATVVFINGFQFTRARISRRKATYRCSSYRWTGCRAKAERTPLQDAYTVLVEHTCQLRVAFAAQEANVVEEMKRRIDALAISELSSTARHVWDIVNQEFYTEAEPGRAAVGLTREQVITRVFNTRRNHYGVEVHGRLEIPPLSLVKNATLRFFQFHHIYYEDMQRIPNQPQRIIGWAHPELIRLLMHAGTTIFVDATFRCVPSHFRQCGVIMVLDQATGLYVPIFYILCTSKTQDTYWNIFNFIVECTDEKIRPAAIVCDFEAALINAVAVQFPEAQRIGCFFHFKQAVRRKMKKLAIPEVQIRIAMQPGVLDMLTVIKRKHIKKKGVRFVQQSIREKCDEAGIVYSATKWERFWRYFAKVWIKKYGPEVWNVHGLDRGLVNRTNNPLERFNREMNGAFSAPHPTLPVFVSTIERLARGHVQRHLDTPSRARKRPRYDIQLSRAVEFESTDESDAAEEGVKSGLGVEDYSDDSDSAGDAAEAEDSADDAAEAADSNSDSDSSAKDSDENAHEFPFEYEGDDASDSAVV